MITILGEAKEDTYGGEYHTVFVLDKDVKTYLNIEQEFLGKEHIQYSMICLNEVEIRQLQGILNEVLK